jgi:type VI secretion system secreted protein VgrG
VQNGAVVYRERLPDGGGAPSAFTQDGRLIAVHVHGFEKDDFLLTGFSGHEAVSQLFQFDLDMLSSDLAAHEKRLVGQNVTFSIHPQLGTRSFFNGFISHFFADEPIFRFGRAYRARIVPWLWFLTRTSNSRIFQNMNVVDIAKKIFADHGLNDYEFRLQRSYSPYEYKVQYRETDFNFVSRLLEFEGIFYFFHHENGRHTAVFGDAPSVFKPGERAKVTLEPDPSWEEIHDWHHAYEFRPGRWTLSDYDFKKPRTDLTATQPTLVDNPDMKKFEFFDHPGEYVDKSIGDGLARTRIEMEEAAYHVVNGLGMVASFRVGETFTLEHHPVDEEVGASYALLYLNHQASETSYSDEKAASSYTNSFVGLPSKTVFRPPRITPCPVVEGPQTATVVGPRGEEIYTDEYGRIKVQFRWDRYGKADENSTMFLRLAQTWAGNKWGAQVLPRIGMEVIVEFLEGDPDRPIVTGCLNNADAMPPDKLPDHRTRSVFRTRSSPNSNGFNEISFEDKAGSEQLFFRGQRDQDIRIKNDVREWVGNERHLIVGQDQLEKVGSQKYPATKHLTVTADQKEKVTGTVSLAADGDMHQKIAQNSALKANMKVAIEAGISITLKTGSSFIEIGPAGITIVGTPLVMINSGGSPDPLTAQPDAPKDPKEADERQPPEALQKASTQQPPAPGAPPVLVDQTFTSPQAAALQQAAQNGTPFCAVCAASG